MPRAGQGEKGTYFLGTSPKWDLELMVDLGGEV
jgi:hypothetical protein